MTTASLETRRGVSNTIILGCAALALAFLAFIGLPSTAEAEIALVQTAHGKGGTPVTATFAATPTQNNLLVAVFLTRNSTTGFFTPVGWGSTIYGTGVSPGGGLFYMLAGANEPKSFTMTSDARGDGNGLMIYEFSGTTTTYPLEDQGGVGTKKGTSNSVTAASGDPPLLNTNDLIIVGMVIKSGHGFSGQTNGFTEAHDFIAGSGGNATLMGGFYRTHSANDNEVTATSTQSGRWLSVFTAFKASPPTLAMDDSLVPTVAEVDNLDKPVTDDAVGGATRCSSPT